MTAIDSRGGSRSVSLGPSASRAEASAPRSDPPVTLFLCGDVMTGRGVDQILAHPNPPDLQEAYVRDARDYVELAERMNGPIDRPVESTYIWGDAIGELQRMQPNVRIINLETSITKHGTYWPGKGIHYRMHPENIGCLTALGVDVCALANNHVLDYGHAGLGETLHTLSAAGIGAAGAGSTLDDARRPVIVDVAASHRVVVFSVGSETSGIPRGWSAERSLASRADVPDAARAGVDLLPDLSDATADDLLERVRLVKQPGDLVVVSIHWGSNWGYDIPDSQIRFAHRLLEGEVDVVHGHSSHHPRAVEIYRNKLVLYGCGDFMSDYEGISGYEEFRDDLVLMYFPVLDAATGHLRALRMTPLRLRRLQLIRASRMEAEWLRDRLVVGSARFGAAFHITEDGALTLLVS